MAGSPGASVCIRSMTEADLDAVADLESRCFNNPWARDALAAELTRSWARLLVAEESGLGVVAFMNYWRVADEVHVLNIATDPAHRRRGHARALLASVMATARAERAAIVLLEVRPSNVAAVALYGAFGFVVTATRQRYYDDGEDAWVMTAALSG